MPSIEAIAALLFALALIRTFSTSFFERFAQRHPRHAGLFHLLGEVEVVFGFWAAVLVAVMAITDGSARAIAYVEARQFTEPLFVFVVMVVAASRPVLLTMRRLVAVVAARLPVPAELATVWLCLAALPLLGSLVTEPAAMTLAALMLAPLIFHERIAEPLKYGALGVLFVNISIGGTLTAYAAPPVLMVADAWDWSSRFMLRTFGWKAALAVLVNATVMSWLLRRHLRTEPTGGAAPGDAADATDSPLVAAVHLLFLAAVVALAHYPVMFIGVFLLFLGFTHAYSRYQSPLILREALLVGFFLAGLVVLGGMQQWWLEPIVEGLEPRALFFSALGLTAVTDNAALTYLGSLIQGLSDEAKYHLVAGAVAGGGLTMIANAPNPAGASLLRQGFRDASIGPLGLLLGAALPTAVAAIAFLL